jgi:hypothetical protein
VLERVAWPRPWSAIALGNAGVHKGQPAWLAAALLLRFGPSVFVPCLLAAQAVYGWPGVISGAALFGGAALAGAAGLWGTILSRREVVSASQGQMSRCLTWSCESSLREACLTAHPVLALALAGWPAGGGLAVYGLLGIAAGTAWTVLHNRTTCAEPNAIDAFGAQRPDVGPGATVAESSIRDRMATGFDNSLDDDELATTDEDGDDDEHGHLNHPTDETSQAPANHLRGPGYRLCREEGTGLPLSAFGQVCVELRAGSRVAVAHLPLSPPWRGTPHCECVVVEGDARVTCLATPHGARLELKRSGDISLPARVWIDVRFQSVGAARKAA